MTPGKSCPPWQRAVIIQSGIITAALILGLFYWARSILIPIAMAIFLSYVLAPVVKSLQRRRLGQAASVILTVSVAVLLFLATSIVISRQISGLTKTLAENAETVKAKIADAKETLVGKGDPRLTGLIDDLEKTIVGEVKDARQAADQPPLVVESAKPKWMASIDQLIGPVTEAFGMAAFSFVLVVFILLAKDDLRDRMLRLIGDTHLPSTTRAIDEATTRLSQYLLAQLVLNVSFGFVIALTFWIFGVKYALLWGFIAALFRYVPYIGTWVGIIPPALFTLATTEGWWLPIFVVAVYAGLELFCNNVIEPYLYGSRLGVSEVGLLVSAAFWSFLWGPIGLILSGPLATCLVVLGRHAPRFRFFEILLGTEPPLAPGVALFQRLMTGDTDEAVKLMEKNKSEENPNDAFDTVFIPALVSAKTAIHSGEFTPEEIDPMIETAREVVRDSLDAVEHAPAEPGPEGRGKLVVIPARDEADELAVEALRRLLPRDKWDVHTVTVDTLAAEFVEKVAETGTDIVCIGSLPPAGLVQVRYLCKRLRQQNTTVRILVGRWGDADNSEAYRELLDVGANAVEVTLAASIRQLNEWRPLTSDAESEPAKEIRPAIGTKAAPTPVTAT
jgi:predicted PurR-regulated permease PerM/methanogenic corrinoid protein MtbC1